MLRGNLRFIKLRRAYALKCVSGELHSQRQMKEAHAGSQTLCKPLQCFERAPGGSQISPPLAASVSGTAKSWKTADLSTRGAVLSFAASGVNSARAPGSFIGGKGGGGWRETLTQSLVSGSFSGGRKARWKLRCALLRGDFFNMYIYSIVKTDLQPLFLSFFFNFLYQTNILEERRADLTRKPCVLMSCQLSCDLLTDR